MRRITFIAVSLVGLWSCSDGPEKQGALVLGWTFIDGRSCADSGVERVVVLEPGRRQVLADSLCVTGFGSPAVLVMLDPGEHRIQVDGLSASETTLYSVMIRATIEPGSTTKRVVELAFTGGR